MLFRSIRRRIRKDIGLLLTWNWLTVLACIDHIPSPGPPDGLTLYMEIDGTGTPTITISQNLREGEGRAYKRNSNGSKGKTKNWK